MKENLKNSIPILTKLAAAATTLTASLLLIWAVAAYSRAARVFTLDRVTVQGYEILSREEIFTESGLSFGDDLFSINPSLTAREIENNPFIERARVSLAYPDGIVIQVKERKPLAFIALAGLHSVDSHAVILPSAAEKNFDLPVITGLEDLSLVSVGEKLEAQNLMTAVKILLDLKGGSLPLFDSISEVSISSLGDMTLICVDGGTVIHLGNSAFEKKLENLRSLLLTVKPQHGLASYKYIDLRYKNQVVVKERAPIKES